MARSLFLQLLSICLALLFSLSLSAPFEQENSTALSKRASALDDLWRTIPGAQKAGGDSAIHFNIDRTISAVWGITYLHGCTAIMISDPDHVIVAHLQEVNSQNCQSISDIPTVKSFIYRKLQPATDYFDSDDNTRIDIMYGSSRPGPHPVGVDEIINFLRTEWGFSNNNLFLWPYSSGSGVGDSPGSPTGKAVVQWTPVTGAPTAGNLQVYFGSGPSGENPMRDDDFFPIIIT